jgi:hypothetical protein
MNGNPAVAEGTTVVGASVVGRTVVGGSVMGATLVGTNVVGATVSFGAKVTLGANSCAAQPPPK